MSASLPRRRSFSTRFSALDASAGGGIQTLQTSIHLPPWLLSSAAPWSQDGVRAERSRRFKDFFFDLFL